MGKWRYPTNPSSPMLLLISALELILKSTLLTIHNSRLPKEKNFCHFWQQVWPKALVRNLKGHRDTNPDPKDVFWQSLAGCLWPERGRVPGCLSGWPVWWTSCTSTHPEAQWPRRRLSCAKKPVGDSSLLLATNTSQKLKQLHLAAFCSGDVC